MAPKLVEIATNKKKKEKMKRRKEKKNQKKKRKQTGLHLPVEGLTSEGTKWWVFFPRGNKFLKGGREQVLKKVFLFFFFFDRHLPMLGFFLAMKKEQARAKARAGRGNLWHIFFISFFFFALENSD